MSRYQVVGACVVVTQQAITGPVKVTLFRGAVLGPGAKDSEIEHNLSIGLIREIGDGPAGVNAAGEPVVDAVVDRGQTDADGDKADDGGDAGQGPDKPARNAGKPTLVLWVVAHRGLDQAAAQGMTKDELWGVIDNPQAPDAGDGDDAELAALREQAVAKGYDKAEVDQASAEDLRTLLA